MDLRIVIYFKDIKELHNPRMVQGFVNVVLPQGMLDVVSLLVLLPLTVQLVDLASYVPLLLKVEPLEREDRG